MENSQPVERDALQDILQQLATLVERRDYSYAAHEFVTDLAVRGGFDRVSLGWVRGQSIELQAISHTDQFDKKSTLARTIGDAMEEALDQKARLIYPQVAAQEEDLPRILRCHGALAQQPGSGVVCSLPVEDRDGVYGVLTLEKLEGRFGATALRIAEATLLMIAPVLHLKWRDSRWVGAKLSDSVRTNWKKLREPGHDGRKVVAIAALLLFLFVCFGKGEHRVQARAYLEGSVQQAAVAPFDGYIGHAPVRAGVVVEEGAVLCSLDPMELELELRRWQSEHEKLARKKRNAWADVDAVQLRVIGAEMDQIEAQRALVEYKLERTEIVAPISGVVVTGDLSQSVGAPIEKGEILFEIAPLDGYRLILEVDEREIAAIEEQQHGEVRLTAVPGEVIPFTVETITPVSTPRDGRNFFRVEARVAPNASSSLRPGMEGLGKISVGSRRFIWLWTHDVVDWVRLGMWAWMPW